MQGQRTGYPMRETWVCLEALGKQQEREGRVDDSEELGISPSANFSTYHWAKTFQTLDWILLFLLPPQGPTLDSLYHLGLS